MANFHTNKPAPLDITIERKSDWTMNLDLEQPRGIPLVLTGATFDCDFVYSAGGAAVVSPTITVVDALAGKLKLSLTSAQTGAMDAGASFLYDLWMLVAGGNRPLLRGQVRVVDEYSTWT